MAARETVGQARVELVGVDKTRVAFNSLLNSMQNLNTMASHAIKSMADLTVATTKLSQSEESASQTSDKMSKSLRDANNDLLQTSLAVGVLSTAINTFTKEVATFAFNYDRNMTMVRAVTNATADEMLKLNKLARDLGQGSEYGAARTAEALLVLSRMGLKATESMQVLEPALKLAQSQQEDLKTTTELVVQQLRVFGEAMNEAGRFSNVLAATSSKTAADLEKLNLALSYAGPIAATAGFNFEEVNATLGIMFNNGIRASRAGTSLRFALTSLAGGTKKTRDALAKMGLSLDEINLGATPLVEVFEKVAHGMTRMTANNERLDVLADIFGKRALPAIAAVLNQINRSPLSFRLLQDSITGTDEAARQFEVQMSSFSGMLLHLRSKIEELALSFTEDLMPSMRLIIGALAKFIEHLQKLPTPLKSFISTTVIATGVVTALVAGLAGLKLSLGFLGRSLAAMNAQLFASQTAMAGLTASTVAASAAATKAAFSFKAMFAAIGGWVTVGIAAVVALSSAIIKGKAATKEAKEAIEKLTTQEGKAAEQVKKLREEVAELTEKYEDLTKAGKDTKDVTLQLELASKKLETAQHKLVTMSPKLIAGWNYETNELIIQTKEIDKAILKYRLLQEEKEKERNQEKSRLGHGGRKTILSDAAQDSALSEINLSKSTEELDKLFDTLVVKSKDAKSSMESFAEELASGYGLTIDQVKLLAETLDKMDSAPTYKAFLELQEQAAGMMQAFGRTRLEIEDFKEDFKGSGRDLVAYTDYWKKLLIQMDSIKIKIKELNATEIKVTGGTKDGKDDPVKKSLMHFDSLIKQLDKFKRKLRDMQDANVWGIEHASMTKYEQGLHSIDKKFADSAKKIQDKLEVIRKSKEIAERKIGESKREVDKKQWQEVLDKILEAENDLDDAIAFNEYARQQKRLAYIKEWSEKMSEATSKMTTESRVANSKLTFQYDRTFKNLDRLYKSQKEQIENNLEAEIRKINDTDGLKKDKENAIFALKVKHWIELNKLRSEYVVKSIELYDEEYEKALKVAEKEEDSLGYLKEKIRLTKELIDRLETSGNIEADPKIRTLKIELEESTTEYAKEVGDTVVNAVNIGANHFSSTLEKAGNDFAAQLVDLGAQIVEQVSNIITSDGEIDTGSMAGSIFSILSQFVQVIGDEVNASDQQEYEKAEEERKLQKEIAEKQYEELVQQTKAQQELAKISYNTQHSNQLLAEMLRETANLNSTNESELNSLNDAANEPMDILQGIEDALQKDPFNMFQNISPTEFGKSEIGEFLKQFGDFTISPTSFTNETGGQTYQLNPTIESAPEWVAQILQGFSGISKEQVASSAKIIADAAGVLGINLTEMTFDAFEGLKDLLEPLKQVYNQTTGQYEWDDTVVKEIGDEFAIITNSLSQEQKDLIKQWEAMGIGISDTLTYTNKWGQVVTDNIFKTDKAMGDLIKSLFQFEDQMDALSIALPTEVGAFQKDFFGLVQAQDWTTLFDNLRADLRKSILEETGGTSLQNYQTFLNTLQSSIDDALKGGAVPPVLKDDFRLLLDEILAKSLDVAAKPEDVELAYAEYEKGLKYMVDTLGGQMSASELLKVDELIESLPTQMAQSISEVTGAIIDPFQTASQDIVDAFNSGAITFEEAMSAVNNMAGKIGDIPPELRKDFERLIRNLRITLMEGEKEKAAAAGGLIDTIESEEETYKENLKALDDEKKDVIERWNDLLELEKQLEENLTPEITKAKEEAQEKIDLLEKERDLLIGNFNFSETQNERSKRFAAIREKENSILDITTNLAETLNDLYEKNAEQLENVKEEIGELEEKYGSLANVEIYYQEQINDLNDEWKKTLEDIGEEYENITGKILDLNNVDLSNVISTLEDFIDKATTATSTLGTLQDEADEETAADVLGSDVTQPNLPKKGYPDLNGDGVVDYKDDNMWRYSPYLKSKYDKKPTSVNSIFAANGFEGLVTSPTRFLTGESGPEYVSVTPMKDLANSLDSMMSGGNSIVEIHEHIDLRGAYGITDKSVAEKIYKEVWAPARRRTLGRVINTRGKAIR